MEIRAHKLLSIGQESECKLPKPKSQAWHNYKLHYVNNRLQHEVVMWS